MFRSVSHKEKRAYKDVIVIVLVVFLLYQLISSYLLTPFVVRQSSMEPEFEGGNRILSTPLYSTASLKRGSLVFVAQSEVKYGFFKRTINAIVSFLTLQLYTPFDAQTTHSTKYLLRRIVALPGDSIYMKDFILYVKPKGNKHFLTEFEVAELDYNINTDGLSQDWKDDLPFSGSMQELTLQEGQYFLLCDNRVFGTDSRLMGMIEGKDKIRQKVLLRYWPINKIRLF